MTVDQGTVRHDPAHLRYEYVLDGAIVAVAEYRLDADVMVMHHTYTEPAHRGQGIAARLVAEVLDDVRRDGRRVVPSCWFVAEFVTTHPEYGDLVVPA